MADTGIAPTRTRIESLDFVRGVALFGILLMNIVGMGLGPAYNNPTIAGGAEGINLSTWFVMNVGIEGTQRALFSILFGAGVILLSAKLEASGRSDHADVYFRRQLWLIAFGVFNAWVLLFEGDILFTYGITALFLFSFRNLPGRTLLALGVGSLLLGAAWSAIETRGMLRLNDAAEAASSVAPELRSYEQKKVIEEWREESAVKPSPERYQEMRERITSSYWSAQAEMSETITRFQSEGLYRWFFEFFGMMMIGMALFKLGVLTLDCSTRVYLAMMVGGYAIGIPGNLAEAQWIMANGFGSLAYHQAQISYDVSRLAMTMGHLGLLMLFLRSDILPWLRRSMAAVGRMALTNYLTHSVVALIVFVLLGHWGAWQRHQLYFLVFGIWAAQLVISPIWLRYFQFGPVEWLWRYLTYGKAPPFRRGAVSEPVAPVAIAAK